MTVCPLLVLKYHNLNPLNIYLHIIVVTETGKKQSNFFFLFIFFLNNLKTIKAKVGTEQTQPWKP